MGQKWEEVQGDRRKALENTHCETKSIPFLTWTTDWPHFREACHVGKHLGMCSGLRECSDRKAVSYLDLLFKLQSQWVPPANTLPQSPPAKSDTAA